MNNQQQWYFQLLLSWIWTTHGLLCCQKDCESPYFMKSPLLIYCLRPPFSNAIHPSPTSLSPQTPTTTVRSVVMFLWLNGWPWHNWCAILHNGNMIIWIYNMSRLGTLVLEWPWFVFYATRRQVYWGLTHNVVFYWYSDLISHTQTHKHTQHTQGPVDWRTHINIYLQHLLCAHSSYFFYID